MTQQPRRQARAGQEREVGYQWRLREVLAEHGIYATTELVPLLRDRGVELSASQVHRLVTGIPERLSLTVLAALCDILTVDPSTLIVTSGETLTRRRPAAADLAATRLPPGTGPHPGPEAQLRPVRARLTRPDPRNQD